MSGSWRWVGPCALLVVVLADPCPAQERKKVLVAPGSVQGLSPELAALQKLGGRLTGYSRRGRAVIDFEKTQEEDVRRRAGESGIDIVAEEPQADVTLLDELLVSYEGDLKDVVLPEGFELRGSSQRGSFLRVRPTRPLDTGLLQRLRDTNAKYIEPNYRISAEPLLEGSMATTGASAPPGDAFDRVWGLCAVHAPTAWSVNTKSTIVVAVLDSGVQYDHEDLVDNILRKGDGEVYGANFVDSASSPYDDGYHGTHVAGIIGAMGGNAEGVCGVCWDVKIMPVKMLDAGLAGTESDAVEAIDWVIDQKKAGVDVRVINASWGTPNQPVAIEDAIRRAAQEGILVVAAAGNTNDSGADPDPYYPAASGIANVISVLAFDKDERILTSSRRGPGVDIGAPGGDIYNALKTSARDYCWRSGTSMATPFVAGAAALAWASPFYDTLTPMEMRELLIYGAREKPAIDTTDDGFVILDLAFLACPKACGKPVWVNQPVALGSGGGASAAGGTPLVGTATVTVRGRLGEDAQGFFIEAGGHEWRLSPRPDSDLRGRLDTAVVVTGRVDGERLVDVGKPRPAQGAAEAAIAIEGTLERIVSARETTGARIEVSGRIYEVDLKGLGKGLESGAPVAVSGTVELQRLETGPRWIIRARTIQRKEER